eukprot:264886-Amphidinium_carterae.2
MLSIPIIHQNKRENLLQSRATTGSTMTFKNWSAEVTTYMSLEKHRLQDILDHVKQQTIPTHDETHADGRKAEEGLSDEDVYLRGQGQIGKTISH